MPADVRGRRTPFAHHEPYSQLKRLPFPSGRLAVRVRPEQPMPWKPYSMTGLSRIDAKVRSRRRSLSLEAVCRGIRTPNRRGGDEGETETAEDIGDFHCLLSARKTWFLPPCFAWYKEASASLIKPSGASSAPGTHDAAPMLMVTTP